MSLDVDRVKAICFDLDGTISDTDDLYVARLFRWIKPIVSPIPWIDPQNLSRAIVMGLETPGNFTLRILDRLKLDNLYYKYKHFFRQRGIQDKPRFSMIPGVAKALEQLRPQYSMALVSAREKYSTHHILDEFNLLDYFDLVVTAETTAFTKPSPDPLLLVAKHFKILPEQLLMIGDTSVDMIAGKSAGAQTIGVLCGFGRKEDLVNNGADLILNSPAELPLALFQ